jgi:hypothetical protein
MFEVIISNVNTGRVWRKLFDGSEAADRHVDRFLDGGSNGPRNRRDYRVEVHYRPAPAVRRVACAVATVEAA